MRTREPTPDRRSGGDHPEQEPLGQLPDSEHGPWTGPSLTIAEAAQMCGVSASTIRRYLAAGRFPTAHQEPGPIPGQRGLWRIPTKDLLAAGLGPRQAHRPDQAQQHGPSSGRTAGQSVDDRVRELEHALELEVPVAEPLRTWPPSGPTRSRPWSAPWRRCTHSTLPRRPTPTGPLPHQRHHLMPGTRPGQPYCQACSRWCQGRRPAKRDLSQEKAAIIGRALSRQQPPKRR